MADDINDFASADQTVVQIGKNSCHKRKSVNIEENNFHKKKIVKIKKESIVHDEPCKISPVKEKKRKFKEETGTHACKTEPHIHGGKTKKTQKKEKKQVNSNNDPDVWKWWNEESHPDGVYWKTLEHNGPYFAAPYEKLPDNVSFVYNNKPFKLSITSEEIASFYAKMLDSDYTKKPLFNNNFFSDWRERMNSNERKIIQNFEKCDFTVMGEYYKKKNEERKAMPKEEKLKLKEENAKISEKYGVCYIDGHLQKIGNFRIEPPGLFRGRGDHPKQGKIKQRVQPKDVIINVSENAKVPDPPEGHCWKTVVHDNKVTWLAQWIENISGSYKYVMLNPTAKIKGLKDMEKYDLARGLHQCIDAIRRNYMLDMSSKEMKVRQRAVALYFIDRLALRAGHEKEDGETADTVGCCSLRVEHIKHLELFKDFENRKYMVEFDFLGKDSVRYVNQVAIEKRVYKNLNLFVKDKKPENDLFDKLSTASVNKYLGELMPGLSAKVFRTYNASSTLQNQLKELTVEGSNTHDMLLSYNRANRAVAILCNHQRAVPKTFDKSMETLSDKIKSKKSELKTCKVELRNLKKDSSTPETKISKKRDQIKRLKDQLYKLKISATDKEENKQIALGTSKLNYLDPRISVSWCRKHDVPIEKIYNKTQRDKFQWAIDMVDSDFIF